MKDVIFWDVDTQKDFIRPDGNLSVEGADQIIPNLDKLVDYARSNNIPIYGSVDYHQLENQEIDTDDPDFSETYPPHCVVGTEGQEKIEATKPLNPLWIPTRPLDKNSLEESLEHHDGEVYIRKEKFDVFANPNTEKIINILQPANIVVFGVALDVCNAHAIDGFLEMDMNFDIHLIKDASKSIDPQKGGKLIAEWKQKGVSILQTEDIIK